MQITIWHNPNCGTSRNVLAALRERGLTPMVVEYLKTPPTETEIRSTLKKLGMSARELMRLRGTPAAELGLDQPGVGDDAIITAMIQHPILIERPVVLAGAKAMLCRPADRLVELLG